MRDTLRTSRIACIVVVMAVLLSIYTSALYELQIKEGDSYLEASRNSVTITETVSAARGSILDRNGQVMVYSRTVYNIILNRTIDRKSTRLNSSHSAKSRMPSSA